VYRKERGLLSVDKANLEITAVVGILTPVSAQTGKKICISSIPLSEEGQNRLWKHRRTAVIAHKPESF